MRVRAIDLNAGDTIEHPDTGQRVTIVLASLVGLGYGETREVSLWFPRGQTLLLDPEAQTTLIQRPRISAAPAQTPIVSLKSA